MENCTKFGESDFLWLIFDDKRCYRIFTILQNTRYSHTCLYDSKCGLAGDFKRWKYYSILGVKLSVNNNTNLNVTGLIYSDGSGNFTGLTLTGTANAFSVTNGDGIAGNPTIALSNNIYVSNLSFDSGTDNLSNYVAPSTWTPVIVGSTIAGLGVYSTQVGYYMRIADLVICWYNLTWSAHTGTGNMTISGFPVTSGSSTSCSGSISSNN